MEVRGQPAPVSSPTTWIPDTKLRLGVRLLHMLSHISSLACFDGKHKVFNTDLNSTHDFTSHYALKISLPVSLTAIVLFRATMPVNLKQPTRRSPVMLSPGLSILPCVICLLYSSSSHHCPKSFCHNFIRS